MAKSLHNSDEEEEFQSVELSAAALKESGIDYDDFIAIARAEEGQKVQASKKEHVRGKALPLLKYMRNSKKDKQPITPEQLGMDEEDNFLTSRQLDANDLQAHQKVNKKGFLGTNFKKPADFMRMFDKGPSTKQQPKLDLKNNLEQNPLIKKTLIAQQILCNLKSEERRERVMMEKLLKDMDLDEEIMEQLLEGEYTEEQEQNLIEFLKTKIPNRVL